eukprot:CAMPEP_0185535662 /NCGR_PEP_ID=MMETSP1366-20130426/109554_1 /TAXON_ID=38817 /ORGANISM="Gephyrocapsa oceanica, Strain RCC1303" /LENGTH=220 /DNA_ID=CAMNT_0028147383 /DNA_START=1559 /DNA_END=2221 /DNA_ORIENTATION=+
MAGGGARLLLALEQGLGSAEDSCELPIWPWTRSAAAGARGSAGVNQTTAFVTAVAEQGLRKRRGLVRVAHLALDALGGGGAVQMQTNGGLRESGSAAPESKVAEAEKADPRTLSFSPSRHSVPDTALPHARALRVQLARRCNLSRLRVPLLLRRAGRVEEPLCSRNGAIPGAPLARHAVEVDAAEGDDYCMLVEHRKGSHTGHGSAAAKTCSAATISPPA